MRKGTHHTKESRRKTSTSMLGNIPWNKGKVGVYSADELSRMRNGHIGKHHSKETIRKLRKMNGGKNNPFFEKHHSIETKKLLSIKARERQLGMVTPKFNPIACQRIDEYGKKHGYHFQHAMNGGEVHIIGYVVDGYDEKKNVVIEYYEKYHNKLQQKKRDERRKKEIVRHLGCKFIELREH